MMFLINFTRQTKAQLGKLDSIRAENKLNEYNKQENVLRKVSVFSLCYLTWRIA